MKRLTIILFLVIITTQSVGLYRQSNNLQYSGLHDIVEKLDDATKEFKKEESVILSAIKIVPQGLLNKSAFKLSHVIIISAPVMDHFAPPPDLDLVN